MAKFKLIIANKNYSSWSLRAWLAMKMTGAGFEEILVPLRQPETSDKIRVHSPSGKVPALVHPGGTVWDSLAIIEFLAERFPEAGLWPSDPDARAWARSVCAEMHAGFMPLRKTLGMNMRARLPARHEAPDVAADIARIKDIWSACRKAFAADGPFLFGPVSAADAVYAPVVSRFITFGVPMEGPVAAYTDAVWNWPILKEWVAEAEAEPHVIDALDH